MTLNDENYQKVNDAQSPLLDDDRPDTRESRRGSMGNVSLFIV